MTTILERLRAALSADYDALEELASGGMGVVFRARDRRLDRLVAIKIVRPELATAAASERFVREARLLAACAHPNIVPIHSAGDADGIPYYVMDYFEGETLAERLVRGPLPPDEARGLGADLLAALDAVHARGIIHRDVKPSNVFLSQGRALLSDFGVSKVSDPGLVTLTRPGGVVGTPGYMAPEQLGGAEVTPAADVCSAAMVMFEAWTGRNWVYDSKTDTADWTGVPDDVAPVLRRALAWSPHERFPDGGAFRRALVPPAPAVRPRRIPFVKLAVLATLVLAVLFKVIFWRPHHVATQGIHVRIIAVGGAPEAARLGDTVAARLRYALRGAPDINFDPAPGDSADLVVESSTSGRADSAGVRLHIVQQGRDRAPATLSRAGLLAPVIDSLAHDVLLTILKLPHSAFGDALPAEALPRTTDGLIELARAEAFYAGAQWNAAQRSYEAALALDSSCALCSLRLITVAQWARLSPDPAQTRRVKAALGRFPARYQLLIRTLTDTADRWALRESLVTQFPRFDLGHFMVGDETFHRGPLAGRGRRQAQDHFGAVTALRPSFAPGWEHRAWLAISEGDQPTADDAMAHYAASTSTEDPGTMVIWMLLNVGHAWRFADSADAERITEGALQRPEIAQVPDLHSGPRYLLGFDAPEGVLWLSRRFTGWPAHVELRPYGFAGQVAALMALGRPDEALRAAAQLRAEAPEPEYILVSAGYQATLALFDSVDVAQTWPRVRDALAPIARDSAANAAQRERAAFWLAMLARRSGVPAETPARRRPQIGDPGLAPFATLLAADSVSSSDPARAIRLTRPLLALDSAGRAGDPFYRTALHLLRARWFLAGPQPDTTAAERELLWYENTDVVGQSAATVQAVDVDWAFGTLARWQRSALTQTPGGFEVCRALNGVARLWQHGEPRYRARAESARLSAERLQCPAAE